LEYNWLIVPKKLMKIISSKVFVSSDTLINLSSRAYI
jgi:hypothetical protein